MIFGGCGNTKILCFLKIQTVYGLCKQLVYMKENGTICSGRRSHSTLGKPHDDSGGGVFMTVRCSFFRYTEEMVPWHPCLKLISNCEQKLSSHTSRRLITMEKVKTFEVNYPSTFR